MTSISAISAGSAKSEGSRVVFLDQNEQEFASLTKEELRAALNKETEVVDPCHVIVYKTHVSVISGATQASFLWHELYRLTR